MRKLLSTLALAALMMGLSNEANATEGWYGRADVGYSFDGEITAFGDDYDLENDWMGSAGVGYAFQNGWRAEGELAYRNNEVDPFDEDIEVWALMANLYYDFNRGGRFQPYVGAGVGYGRMDFFDLDDESWAWQAMAGVAVELTERLDLDIGVRHFEMEGAELDLDGTTDVEYRHDAVMLGLRYQFSAPAAPPPPPPPPPTVTTPPPPPACPTSEFTVYFEWDRSNLNQAALDTIDAAVERARQCNVGSVVVIGHTDTSGSAAYNVGLSERRAGVVRDALVARGISGAAIRTEARGETDLASPTRDGVREPLNRRTAVTISFR